MRIPRARGPMSEVLFAALRGDSTWSGSTGPADADDSAIALWTLYELHYGGFEDVDDGLEWDPTFHGVRRDLERDLEARLRSRYTSPAVADDFANDFFTYVEDHDGRSLASHVQRHADHDQVLELLRVRSIYHLKESDPTAWVVPRLPVGPKAALMALLYDEYGVGDPNNLHAHLFARGMTACGLNADYGVYIDEAPTEIFDQNNAMTLFGLHRRLRGAALGHLAAFEATSSVPSRKMAQGFERLGLPRQMIDYYVEHAEADAVHEQLAVRTICGGLVDAEPESRDEVFFGAFTCLDLEDRFAGWMLEHWGAVEDDAA